MYILFGNVANSWKIIDMSVDKKDIVNTMVDISNKHNFYDYKIEETGADKNNPTYVVGEEALKVYLQNYRKRIKPLDDMSCVDLKRYILDKKGLK